MDLATLERIVKLETKLEQQDHKIESLRGEVIDLKKLIDCELKDIKDVKLKDIKEILDEIKRTQIEDKAKVSGGWRILTIIGAISVGLAAIGKLAMDLFKN